MKSNGFRSGHTLHGTKSMSWGTSESSRRGDSSERSQAGSSSAAPAWSETPVPLPPMPVMLGTLAPGRKRSDYQEATVVDDDGSLPLGGKWSTSTETVPASRVVKETPVPLPPRVPQRQAVQATPKLQASSTSPQRLHETASAPQWPPTVSRRGRPRGWRPGMSYAAIRGHAHSTTVTTSTTTTTTTTTTTPPRRGRPPMMRPAAAGGATRDGVAAGSAAVKRRGRPPKQPSPAPVDIYRRGEAPFVAFLCEWEGCPAELQNLETLRRHLRVVHLRQEGGHQCQCRWGRCWMRTVSAAAAATMGEKGGEGEGMSFGAMEALEAHVEEAHLVPFSWHIGDGPRNDSGRGGSSRRRRMQERDEGGDGDDEDVPDYLKDVNGNQVTPSIKGQQVEDYATWRSNRKKLKELLLERDRNLPSEDEEGKKEEEGKEGVGEVDSGLL